MLLLMAAGERDNDLLEFCALHFTPLYTRYPIVARALGLAAFRPSARASKGILHTSHTTISLHSVLPLHCALIHTNSHHALHCTPLHSTIPLHRTPLYHCTRNSKTLCHCTPLHKLNFTSHPLHTKYVLSNSTSTMYYIHLKKASLHFTFS